MLKLKPTFNPTTPLNTIFLWAIFSLIFIFSSKNSYALDCNSFYEFQKLIPLHIDYTPVTNDRMDLINQLFINRLDPQNSILLESDVIEFNESITFMENDETNLKIGCEAIEYFAQVFHLRLSELSSTINDLSFEDVKPNNEIIQILYEEGDYADDYPSILKRWINLAKLQGFIISLSKPSIKPQKLMLAVKTHFKHMLNWAHPQRNMSHYYHHFLNAMINSYDPMGDFRGQRDHPLTIYALEKNKSILNLSSIMTISNVFKKIQENIFRLALGGEYFYDPTSNLPEYKNYFIPNDLLLATQIKDNQALTDIFHIGSTFNLSLATTTNKQSKKIVVLRKNDNNDHHSVIKFNHKFDLNYAKARHKMCALSNFAPQNTKDQKIRSIGYLHYEMYLEDVQSSVDSLIPFSQPDPKKLDAIVIDLVQTSPFDPEYVPLQQAIDILSLFLPEKTPLGIIETKLTEAQKVDSNTDEKIHSEYLFAQRPKFISEESYEILQNVPIVIVLGRQTAGISEWLAKVLRQHNRALIIGEDKTVGRDYFLQKLDFPTNKSSSLAHYDSIMYNVSDFVRISTSRLYPPSGLPAISEEMPFSPDIHLVNVFPDIPRSMIYSVDDEVFANQYEQIEIEFDPNNIFIDQYIIESLKFFHQDEINNLKKISFENTTKLDPDKLLENNIRTVKINIDTNAVIDLETSDESLNIFSNITDFSAYNLLKDDNPPEVLTKTAFHIALTYIDLLNSTQPKKNGYWQLKKPDISEKKSCSNKTTKPKNRSNSRSTGFN